MRPFTFSDHSTLTFLYKKNQSIILKCSIESQESQETNKNDTCKSIIKTDRGQPLLNTCVFKFKTCERVTALWSSERVSAGRRVQQVGGRRLPHHHGGTGS